MCMEFMHFPRPRTLHVCILVDGEWDLWTDWTPCNVTCGGGELWRTRQCEQPKHGGLDCEGDSIQVKDCNTFPCPGE